jgi:hypothetical protein
VYLQRARSDIHSLVADVSNPALQDTNRQLQSQLGEIRTIQMELMRLRNFSPQSLQRDALQAALDASSTATTPSQTPASPASTAVTSAPLSQVNSTAPDQIAPPHGPETHASDVLGDALAKLRATEHVFR